ncbi:related to RRP46-Exosome non-catalytic core component [Ustilago bromivora]|uniref:Related to RRP46 - Exosome non-catalytic core component n=1 Tax=Ustilago bromivora TaxID=307758 RepID=A0A1K0GRR2_9BASI|nr:related to RRP46-Exosome non-catalytic core component [Ustilago bromivora]SYW82666.1 related to RRP46 - Exosome non-catalytic core component [Ustilago bromivora]
MSSSISTKHGCSAPRRTSPTALRPLSAQLGTLARADASASFSLGPLNVVASVSGPTEVRIRDELTDRATLDVIFQPQHGVAGIPSQAVSDSLFTAFSSVLLLHHYPRSLIQVVLQTLSCPTLPQSSAQVVHSGVQASQRVVARQPLLLGPDKPPSVSELAALINAASLALLDAGIPARGSVAACACAILPAARGMVLRQNSHLSEIGEAQLAGLLRQYKQENGEAEDEPSRSRTRYTGDTVVLLDPTPVELDYALSTHLFAFSFSQALDDTDKKAAPRQVSEQILAQSQGAVDLQDLERARELGFKACSAVVGFMRTALHKRVVAQIA